MTANPSRPEITDAAVEAAMAAEQSAWVPGTDGDAPSKDSMRAALTAALLHLAAGRAEAVAELDWEDRSGDHYAETILGEVCIGENGDGLYVIESGRLHSGFGSVDAAKAFVERDGTGSDHCEPCARKIAATLAAPSVSQEVLWEAIAEMRATAADLRDPCNSSCDTVRQARYWDEKADRLAALAQSAVPVKKEDRPRLLGLHRSAIEAVTALDDWTSENEAQFTGWGDGDVPAGAEFWRVKGGQALDALREIRPEGYSAAPVKEGR